MKPRTNPFYVFLPIAIAMSFVFAVTFVVSMTVSLPKTDLAYGSNPFADPFIFGVMFFVAVPCGLLACPLLWLMLRRVDLYQAVPCVTAAVMVCTAVGTMIHPAFGFPGAFIWMIFAGAIASRVCSKLTWPGECPACGYDLRGTIAAGIARCPECGLALATTEPHPPADG